MPLKQNNIHMTKPDHKIIFHAYPQSPVAEKIRVAFGIKQLSWHSVEIPRLPPKPLLTTLTGGYRRTPVMQIGADIYCDSFCITEELEARFLSPSIYPTADAGLARCLSRWTDGALFDLAVKIVLGAAGDSLPEDFAEDRGRLYLGGDNWAENLKKANTQLPHLVAQLRVYLSWLDQMLADGRKFLLCNEASAFDAQIYHVVWFIRGRFNGGEALLAEFPNVTRWEKNTETLGHGTSTSLSAEDAIQIAGATSPKTKEHVADNDPQGLKLGMKIKVGPDVESGEQFVTGTVRYADAQRIAINRICDQTNSDVCVHFPRTGYRIEV